MAYWTSWAAAAGSASQVVERSSLPILVLGGEHDWNVPPEHGRDQQLPPDSRIDILSDLTHILNPLDPAALRRHRRVD